jgi:hypothetical protein
MISTFLELEDNILKLMSHKQTIENETDKIIQDNNSFLRDLEQRSGQLEIEEEKLYQEKMKDLMNISQLKKHTECTNSEESRMIQDLYSVIVYKDLNSFENISKGGITKNKFKKSNQEMIKEIIDTVRKMEFDINDYFTELERIKSDKKTLDKIVENRKNENLVAKQNENKIKDEEIIHEKRMKAEERMHRIVIRGRGIVTKSNANKGVNKLKKLDDDSNNKNEDYDDLKYE